MFASYMGKLKAALWELVWAPDLSTMAPLRARSLRFVRAMHMVVRELADGQLTLQAMSLVYTTLLSLVPLLAVSFSVLKAFGVHNQIEPALLNFLAPLGGQGAEITSRVVEFVENIRVGLLGSIGLAMLFYIVVSLIQKIERAFNSTWRVSQPRSLAERFSDYFSVIVIGPVLVFAALGITASLMSTSVMQALVAIEPFGTLVQLATKLVPYLLVVAAFTCMYLFIPNTRVQLSAAGMGALVAAVLWQSTGWAFASFVVASTNYTAIYSSFAILILFMIWLYLSWLILLVGASVAFFYQHPEYMGLMTREISLSGRLKEHLSLMAMFYIGQQYYNGQPPWSTDALARCLHMPVAPLETLLRALEESGLLLKVREDPPAYVPARDLDRIGVADVLDSVRALGEHGHLSPRRLPAEPAVDALLEALDRARHEAVNGCSLRDLAAETLADPCIASFPDRQRGALVKGGRK